MQYAPGSIHFDNIQIYEAEMKKSYNKISTLLLGTFLADWLGNNPEAKIVFEDGVLKLDITNVGAVGNTWEIQVIQDAFALGIGPDNEGSLQLESGKTYRLKFKAAASVDGKINIAFGWMDGSNWVSYYGTPEEEQPEHK